MGSRFQERHTLKWSRESFAGASSMGARPNGSSDAASIAMRFFFWGENSAITLYIFILFTSYYLARFGNPFFFWWQTCIQPLRQKMEDHCGCFCLSTGLTIPAAGRISIFSTTLHDLFVDRRAPECGWPETGHENFWTRTRHLAACQTGWRSLSGGYCTYWQRRPSAYAERAEQLAKDAVACGKGNHRKSTPHKWILVAFRSRCFKNQKQCTWVVLDSHRFSFVYQ